ncbi:hypothetical protein E0Z10_g5407 [Xylaria hypoxylon]|uniref:Uncharacterized protein n=1 Tax=Xylaria hypoxylon TaxID=37992 RepID=A0A4Z0YY12_9PEZI|nr:hypothetical protein E0Z10_g5407 [Xylaria hypoxylon]
MAYSGSSTQKSESNTLQTQSQSQDEGYIYDLDDPYLIPNVLSQQPTAAGTMTCRFLAMPFNEAGSFFHNITQYGYIIHESREKLIMRVGAHNMDLIDRIRQIWVSKYLTPFTECRITFDLPKRDQMTTIIIQRVLGKFDKDTADCLESDAMEDPVTKAGEAPMTIQGAAAFIPRPSDGGRVDAMPRTLQRRRATSLPSSEVLAELSESPWHLPQILS